MTENINIKSLDHSQPVLNKRDNAAYYNRHKEKLKENARRWYERNRDTLLEQRRQYSLAYRRANPKHRLLSAARQRAKIDGLAFDITEDDFSIPTHCPILGCPLEVGARMYAPSLDRFIPEKGYIKGNVWVISLKANVMKNNATPNELKKFAQWVESESRI